MTTTAFPGPLSIEGLKPPMLGPVPYIGGQPALGVPENPDFSPSLIWCGFGVRDPRYLQRIGAGANVAGGYPNQDCGWMFAGAGLLVVDQVPSVAAVNNIAVAATVTSGVPMTLVSSSGAGITVTTAPFTVLPTGNVVPKGSLAVDGNPAWTGSGTSGAFAFFNPTNAMSRAISITATSTAVGGAFACVYFDLYGVLTHETITAVTNTTVNGKKAVKWVVSITPQFTDTTGGHTYSVGTSDVFGLPLYAAEWPGMLTYFAAPQASLITASPTFVAGVTSTATATTGDVRGTVAPSASDGSKKLTIYQPLNFGVIAASYAAVLAALVGVPQF
jgi:hypothetical protein